MSKTASSAARKASNFAQYVAAHPTLQVIGLQPDRIERMDTPEKLQEYKAIVAQSLAQIPSLGYTTESGEGQTATYSYVGDKPVCVDHDSDT
jgi:hypothetical protein